MNFQGILNALLGAGKDTIIRFLNKCESQVHKEIVMWVNGVHSSELSQRTQFVLTRYGDEINEVKKQWDHDTEMIQILERRMKTERVFIREREGTIVPLSKKPTPKPEEEKVLKPKTKRDFVNIFDEVIWASPLPNGKEIIRKSYEAHVRANSITNATERNLEYDRLDKQRDALFNEVYDPNIKYFDDIDAKAKRYGYVIV